MTIDAIGKSSGSQGRTLMDHGRLTRLGCLARNARSGSSSHSGLI
jgi:hypothetical protein